MTAQTVFRIPVPSKSNPTRPHLVTVYRDGLTGTWVGICDHECEGYRRWGRCSHTKAATAFAAQTPESDLALLHVPEPVEAGDPFEGVV